MIEPVERKIQEINTEKKKALRKQKEKNLLRWGFDGQKKNKKDIPLILTDEEYEAILEADKELSAATKTDRNPMANILYVFAIAAIVIGILAGAGIYLIYQQLIYASLALVVGIMICVLFMGMSEIIKMLQQLIDKK